MTKHMGGGMAPSRTASVANLLLLLLLFLFIYLFITPLRQHSKIQAYRTHKHHAHLQNKTTTMHSMMP